MRIVYIAGSGRSGSTLLSRLLSSRYQAASLGELRYVWERGFGANAPCACGETFLTCPLWASVAHRLQNADVDPSAARLDQMAVDRLRHIPRLVLPRLRTEAVRAHDRYFRSLRELYGALIAETGEHTLIDSSKDPSYLYVLAAMEELDLFVLHLVRDSRAVAHSWQRKQRRFPLEGREELMRQHRATGSAHRWNRVQGLVLPSRWTLPPQRYRVLRYEDLVASPNAVVAGLGAWMGLSPRSRSGDGVDASATTLRLEHLLSGNPMRFRSGEVEVAPDLEWHEALSGRDYLAVTALTLPFLLGFRYPLRRSAGAGVAAGHPLG